MSVSEQMPSYSLTVDASQQYRYITKLSVFDGLSRRIDSQVVMFPYSKVLPRGLYTIRMEISGAFRDSIITHDRDGFYMISTNSGGHGDRTIVLDPPDIYSAALFYDHNKVVYQSSHEYYTQEAQTGAGEFTCEFEEMKAADSSLWVFLRYSSKQKFVQQGKGWRSFEGYELLDSKGDLLCSFGENRKVKANFENGWLSFNASLSEGLYYLSCLGENPRMVPVYVYRGWHTQFFLLIGTEPLYGAIRIFLSRSRYYDPYNENNKITDVLLNKLQNRDYTLNVELLNPIADGKFESPMLGLLGAYLYLSGDSDKNDNLFRIILTNMQQLILKDNDESPDLQALRILANRHFGESYKIRNTVIKGTPMLRIGYEAIKAAAVEKSRIIKTNSINDLITENTFSDSPFNTFKPVRIRINEFKKKNLLLSSPDSEEIKKIDLFEEPLSKYEIRQKLPEIRENRPKRKGWNVPVRDILGTEKYNYFLEQTAEENPDLSWLSYSIADALKKQDALTIKQLSKQMQVPAKTVSRIVKDFRKLSPGA